MAGINGVSDARGEGSPALPGLPQAFAAGGWSR
jgi:hypothetical protein